MPFFIWVLIALGLGVAMWNRIMTWAKDQLFPWLSDHLPWLSDAAAAAFAELDNQAVEIRNRVKKAWNRLRPHLLEQIVEFEQGIVPNTYIRRMTALIRKSLEPGASAILLKEEAVVPWDQLPDKYRNALLKGEGNSYRIDVTETRDQELEE